jgi:hypothetical protein
MSAADSVGGSFGKAEMIDLACRDQVFDHTGNVFDRHVGIDTVLIEC